MPKTKSGEVITWKEFFKRWGEGIEGITPKQKIKTQILGTKISLGGMFGGLLISIYAWKQLWWVGIILIGAIINTLVQYLGQRQQLNQFKKLDEYEEVDIDYILNEKEVN